MDSNIGRNINISIQGESHSERIGVVVRGFPIGAEFSRSKLDAFMDRRIPGYSCEDEGFNEIAEACATSRREADKVIFERGVVEDGDSCIVVGSEIEAAIYNNDVRREDYNQLKTVLRPGHADLGAFMKYGSDGLKSGGGQFSGRMTALLCIAGGIAKQLLSQIGTEVHAELDEIGGLGYDKDSIDSVEAIIEAAAAAREAGDSLGGVVKLDVSGYPGGIGGALLEGLEGDLARAMFAIPSVKGFESGSGFRGSRLRGSQNNDSYYIENGRIRSDGKKQGGISGGISTGMDICCRVAFKPIPSISIPQRSVDIAAMEETTIEIQGRHDVCCVPRALPIVEAMAALALYDRLRGENE